MKKAKKRPAQNGNRREELLAVCARLFREKGFDGTSIRDISEAAGMHSGSPFYHFKSKQEMLVAVMEQGLTEGLRHLEAVALRKLPPADKFRQLVRTHLETICGDGHDFIPVMLYDWRSLTPANRRRVIALKDRYDALWQKVTDELQAQGVMPGDAQLARLFTFGVLNWTARWYRPGGRKSLDEIAEETARFLLRG
ncbi:MAG TPA: TetR/AcrR family transcriptional regulator [Burkholderiales bacterium]|nr:TetR/AcrR family transcriptional regulator [Burkholderiales bacterium]